MAGGANQEPGGMITGINVTPFVDIVLVLLIIFMVTAKMVYQPASAVPLTLPKASKGESVQTVLSLSLKADGALFANGKPLSGSEALLPLARAEVQADPKLSVVIQADGDVPHKRIIQVMDVLSQAGISQIAFGVQVDPALAAPSQGTPAPALPATGGVTP